MKRQHAFDPRTAEFLAKVGTAMPPMPGDVMNAWGGESQALTRTLMRSVGRGPGGTHVPRFPIASLVASSYLGSADAIRASYNPNRFVWNESKQLRIFFKAVDECLAVKSIKRQRTFVGVYAEFLPSELVDFMQEHQYIPPGLFEWVRENGLREITYADAAHLPHAIPQQSPWYGVHTQVVPMIRPIPAKSEDPGRPLLAWHADQLATTLCLEPRSESDHAMVNLRDRRFRIEGLCALDLIQRLQNPDTIMVFWA